MPQILGYLFAALLSLGIWKTFAKVEQESNDRVRNSATAGQQRKFNSAVEKYASTYFTNLSAAATATVPVTITVAMLQDPTVNLLDASFGTLNPYGQTWQAQVLQPTSGTLRVMSYGAGGTALPDRTVASIAAMIGENGGFVPRNDSGAYPTGASAAIGSFGGWQASTSGYTGMVGGRTVALATLTNGQLVSNYLYRNAVPGQPQLNQMNTALGMSGNDINSVGKITNVSMNTSGDVKIAGKLDVTGTITTPANASAGVVDLENVSVENTACPKIGRQSRDSSGLPLSCQSTSKGIVWKPAFPDFETPVNYSADSAEMISIVQTAKHRYCAMTAAGGNAAAASYNRCVVYRNPDGTWVLDNRATAAGGWNVCEATCFN